MPYGLTYSALHADFVLLFVLADPKLGFVLEFAVLTELDVDAVLGVDVEAKHLENPSVLAQTVHLE